MTDTDNRADDRSYSVVGHVYRILTTTEVTGGFYTIIEGIIPPEDPGPPPHTHSREDESFYIVEGNFKFFLGDEEIKADPGDYIHCPRRIRHTFRNVGKSRGKVLVVVSPSGFEKFLQEVGEAVQAGTTSVPPPDPEHIQKLIETAPKYGLIIHT